MAAKRMGRPKKADGERLSGRLEIRVSVDERERMQGAAERAGKNLSDWLRSVAIDAAG